MQLKWHALATKKAVIIQRRVRRWLRNLKFPQESLTRDILLQRQDAAFYIQRFWAAYRLRFFSDLELVVTCLVCVFKYNHLWRYDRSTECFPSEPWLLLLYNASTADTKHAYSLIFKLRGYASHGRGIHLAVLSRLWEHLPSLPGRNTLLCSGIPFYSTVYARFCILKSAVLFTLFLEATSLSCLHPGAAIGCNSLLMENMSVMGRFPLRLYACHV